MATWRAEPMKFAKRYALVGEDEYKRLLSTAGGGVTTSTTTDGRGREADNFLEDIDVKDAKLDRSKLVSSITNPFLDTDTKMREHARLLEKYLKDLGRIRERAEGRQQQRVTVARKPVASEEPAQQQRSPVAGTPAARSLPKKAKRKRGKKNMLKRLQAHNASPQLGRRQDAENFLLGSEQVFDRPATRGAQKERRRVLASTPNARDSSAERSRVTALPPFEPLSDELAADNDVDDDRFPLPLFAGDISGVF